MARSRARRRSDARSRILSQGLTAGLIGYTALALLVALADVLGGASPVRTASVLGASLFYGVTDPAELALEPAYVVAYNVAHLLVFLMLGVLASALTALADRRNHLWFVSACFHLFIAFHAIAFVQALSEEMEELVAARTIWAGGIAASLAMAGYVVWTHPRMRRSPGWAAWGP